MLTILMIWCYVRKFWSDSQSSFNDSEHVVKKPQLRSKKCPFDPIVLNSRLEDDLKSIPVSLADMAVRTQRLFNHDHDPNKTVDPNISQRCILSVSDQWGWLSTLIKCTQVHVQDAAVYHQYFHLVDEYGYSMNASFDEMTRVTQSNEQQNSCNEALFGCLDSWKEKVDIILKKSATIVPYALRRQSLSEGVCVTVLCNYSLGMLDVVEGEILSLVDNSDPNEWKVLKNVKVMKLPSTILRISSQDKEASKVALQLQSLFFSLSINSLQNDCQSYVSKMLIALEEELAKDITRLLTLSSQRLESLKASACAIRSYLFDSDEQLKKQTVDRETRRKDRLQTALKYSLDWLNEIETFTVTDTANKKDFQVLTKTKNNVNQFSAFCNKALEFLKALQIWGSSGCTDDSPDGRCTYNNVEHTRRYMVQSGSTSSRLEETKQVHVNQRYTHSQTETAHHTTSEQRQKLTYVIKGIIDPRDNRELMMKEAVQNGIINRTKGTYVDIVNGTEIPIQLAINRGLILVDYQEEELTVEKCTSAYIITIKTQRETRSYTVVGVIDAWSGQRFTIAEAADMGILNFDERQKIYKNLNTGEDLSFEDAFDSGLLVVEFSDIGTAAGANTKGPKTETKTYAVHSVVDVKEKTQIFFEDAANRGIIFEETEEYINNVTGERINLADAIKRGLIKASVVNDPTVCGNITEGNRVVDENIKRLREQVIGPMKAMFALKKSTNKQAADFFDLLGTEKLVRSRSKETESVRVQNGCQNEDDVSVEHEETKLKRPARTTISNHVLEDSTDGPGGIASHESVKNFNRFEDIGDNQNELLVTAPESVELDQNSAQYEWKAMERQHDMSQNINNPNTYHDSAVTEGRQSQETAGIVSSSTGKLIAPSLIIVKDRIEGKQSSNNCSLQDERVHGAVKTVKLHPVGEIPKPIPKPIGENGSVAEQNIASGPTMFVELTSTQPDVKREKDLWSQTLSVRYSLCVVAAAIVAIGLVVVIRRKLK